MSLLDKVKETAQKGADKAKEGVKAGQDKIETVKAERKVKDLKEEIGGIIFTQRTGGTVENADAEIARLVAEIQATEASIAETGAEGDAGTDSAGGDAAASA
jgi:hypothetical protein